MKGSIALLTLTVLLSLASLSVRSNYRIHDVESINWEIALMLTPAGYLNNLVLQSDHYLAPYYQELAARGSLLSDPLFLAQLLANTIIAFLALRRLRGGRV